MLGPFAFGAVLLTLQGDASAAPISSDPIASTRSFLEAFADDPAGAARFVTADAMVVAGDIGGRYPEFVEAMRPWPMASCRVATLRLAGILPEDSSEDVMPHLRGAPIMVVGGSYACARPDGPRAELPVSVYLKHGRVVILDLDTMHLRREPVAAE